MPNLTLDSLAADIYAAADTVGRELTGFIPSVSMNSDSALAPLKVTLFVLHLLKLLLRQDVSEWLMTVPEGTDVTVDNKHFNNLKI